jgi:3-isopropylmalate/(R)-2-methylmalate dehydratase small subunit
VKPLTRHVGRAVRLRRDDVDTDQIVPAEYCKRLTKSGYADALFATWRADPGFVLNQPASDGATILVAGHNFGTGSSREHAVWALRDGGFVAVIATSFGDIFRRNALKNGLLAVQLPGSAVARLAGLVEAAPDLEITVDLVTTRVMAPGVEHEFDVDGRARRLLLDGLDEIDVTLARQDAILRYERARRPWLPRIVPTAPIPATGLTAEVRA